ncbi:MAG: DNA polymerase III subunit chi [Rhodocyclaceae bacterium]|nr:DNA polymerase III subunit chi [Rhodocyclaceae bacterium]
MTEVHFYHNAHDLLGATCRLTAKAFGAGRKVTVLLPDAEHARTLDALLWTDPPTGFVPHVPSTSPLAGETPVTLTTSTPDGDWPHDDVLINLAPALPPRFEQFKMVVEVVGAEEHHRQPARERWRHYAAQGFAPTPHNMRRG